MSKQIYLFSTSSHPDAISINSLDIKLLKPNIDFSKYDYLIITSKQACEALKQYDKEKYINKKALCVSAQSALSFESLGGKVLDIGNGYGDNFIDKIKGFEKNTRWLYLRAKVVASDFYVTSKNEGYHIDEKIVYSSECSKEILETDVKDNSILIFTSPSSIECFLKHNTINKNFKVIVIGKTTATSVPLGVECYVSEKTSIQSCMELAFKL